MLAKLDCFVQSTQSKLLNPICLTQAKQVVKHIQVGYMVLFVGACHVSTFQWSIFFKFKILVIKLIPNDNDMQAHVTTFQSYKHIINDCAMQARFSWMKSGYKSHFNVTYFDLVSYNVLRHSCIFSKVSRGFFGHMSFTISKQ